MTRHVALPDPASTPVLGIVVSNAMRPFELVVPSDVIVEMPGMLSVNVIAAPASALPSGSVTEQTSRMPSGSDLREIR